MSVCEKASCWPQALLGWGCAALGRHGGLAAAAQRGVRAVKWRRCMALRRDLRRAPEAGLEWAAGWAWDLES